MKRRIMAILTALAVFVTGLVPVATVFADTSSSSVPKLTKVVQSFPGATLTWEKADCNLVYQIQASQSSDFKGAQNWYPAKNATTYKIQNKDLADGKRYYVRIRTINNSAKGKIYGAWSETKSVVVKTTTPGLKENNVDAYKLGTKSVYYQNSVPKTGEVKLNGNRYYFEKGKFVAERKLMWDGVRRATSKTKYLVTTDCKYNWTYIYKKQNGNWVIFKKFRCTTGGNDTPTPKVNKLKPGGNKVKFSGYNDTRKRKPYTCWFASRFQGSCFYHSVLYWKDDKPRKIMSGKLGASRSHGCIRVSLSNAIWMYRNIKKGTRIITFSNKIPKAK